MCRTAPSRQLGCLSRITEWIKTKRHLPKRKYFTALKCKLVGQYNYYYVGGKPRSVWSFYSQVTKLLYKWLNRRSQRKSYTWKQLNQLMKYVDLSRTQAHGKDNDIRLRWVSPMRKRVKQRKRMRENRTSGTERGVR
jgi:hypothetical protein